jgi:hypothetical protein
MCLLYASFFNLFNFLYYYYFGFLSFSSLLGEVEVKMEGEAKGKVRQWSLQGVKTFFEKKQGGWK